MEWGQKGKKAHRQDWFRPFPDLFRGRFLATIPRGFRVLGLFLLMSPLRRTLIIAFRISLALVALAVLNVRAEADSAAGEDVYFEGTLVDTWSPDWQATANTRVGCNWFGNRSHCQWGSSLFAENLREQCIIHYSHIDQWATELAVDVCLDYEDFYSCRGLALQGVGLGIAAVMANTSIDQEFQDWHDADVKSKSSDKLSGAFKWLGEGYITIPGAAGSRIHRSNPTGPTPSNRAIRPRLRATIPRLRPTRPHPRPIRPSGKRTCTSTWPRPLA